MDPDSGNALNAVTVSTKGKTGENVEVDCEKADVDISRPLSPAESSTNGDAPLEPVFSRIQELPFSKARLIALVATLSGAAFLNVSVFITYVYGANLMNRHWASKLLLLSFLVSERLSIFQKVASNGSYPLIP
jgi:hypothetical protein